MTTLLQPLLQARALLASLLLVPTRPQMLALLLLQAVTDSGARAVGIALAVSHVRRYSPLIHLAAHVFIYIYIYVCVLSLFLSALLFPALFLTLPD